ncbi:MAG: glycerate kinase [Acidimicrobiales bacterium]|nr:glycerate kinase [Acidimicrobiales bacterium]
MRVLAAPDKFRGTVTAAEAAAAIAAGVRESHPRARVREVPLSDGGEGFTDAFGGANRVSVVTGPLGEPTPAGWRLSGRTAVIEMAAASGLALVGGPEANDPVAASTRGTGELIGEAVDLGARRIFVGHGGSATTDGGLAALQALFPTPRLRGVELIAAVDVRCRFLDAAREFAGQKGASASQIELLSRRLERLAQVYLEDHGVDVVEIEGGGAAGGLAGGLAAVGASVVSGFELIAEELDLASAVEEADLVVTGEGFVDAASFDGKVVGGVAELAREFDVPVVVVAGEVFDGAGERVEAISLVERFGRERALADAAGCLAEVVAERLADA